jgi:DNA ligase 1
MILYKKDSKGKLRVLEIFAEGDQVVQRSGLFDGKRSETRSSCIGKNIGRSNETSPEEQALSEAEAKIKKKLEKEYFTTKEEAEGSEVLLPMLAKDYKKEFHKIDWSKDVFMQPKFDGMRCLAILDPDGSIQLLSREGKNIQEQYGSMGHIIKNLKECTASQKRVVLDGELYAHGLSFQENMKLIKKYRGDATHEIKFNVYDMVRPENFTIRLLKISMIVENLEHVKISNTVWSVTKDMVKSYHEKFLAEGYEGSIIRHGNDGYKVKGRSSSLLKYKDFLDGDFEVVDIVPFEKYPEQGKIFCKDNGGNGFYATPKMSHKDRESLLKNKAKYIGKIANIRYFEKTDEGVPRFPIFVGFHEDR